MCDAAFPLGFPALGANRIFGMTFAFRVASSMKSRDRIQQNTLEDSGRPLAAMLFQVIHQKENRMNAKDGNSGEQTQTKFDRLAHLKDVVGIRSAFAGCADLKSVVIPEGVSFIGDFAFADCTNLSRVVLPSSLCSIGDGAFCGCARLKSVTIPKGELSRIGDGAFCGTLLLEDSTRDGVAICDGWVIGRKRCPSKLTLPRGIRGIANGVFADCVELKSVTIPGGVKKIPTNAFEGCKNLKSVVISDGVASIGLGAFQDCWQLANVSIPASVVEIVDQAFAGTALVRNAETGVAICDGWVVGGNVRCPAKLDLPKGIHGIARDAFGGWDAFAGRDEFVSVTIPESVTVIPEKAFSSCSSLQSVVIPDGGIVINDAAFYGCSSLKTVVFEGLPPRIEVDFPGPGVFPDGAIGYYPPKCAAKWRKVIGKDGKWEGLKMKCAGK